MLECDNCDWVASGGVIGVQAAASEEKSTGPPPATPAARPGAAPAPAPAPKTDDKAKGEEPGPAPAPLLGTPEMKTNMPEVHYSLEYSNRMRKTPIVLVLDPAPPCPEPGGDPACTCSAEGFAHAAAKTWRTEYATGKKIPGTEERPLRSPYQVVMPGETLVIELPLQPGGKRIPSWRCGGPAAWNNGGRGASALALRDDNRHWHDQYVEKDPNGVPESLKRGTPAAETKPRATARVEYNVNTNTRAWYNLSLVDGINANLWLQYWLWDGAEWKKEQERRCLTDMDSCPRNLKKKDSDGKVYTCMNPRELYIDKPGTPDNDLSGCGEPRPGGNKPCHVWWNSNSEALAWKKWMQQKTKCDAYAWAYDEKVCKNPKCDGGYVDNPVHPLLTTDYTNDRAKLVTVVDNVLQHMKGVAAST
eukprot:g1020.t1